MSRAWKALHIIAAGWNVSEATALQCSKLWRAKSINWRKSERRETLETDCFQPSSSSSPDQCNTVCPVDRDFPLLLAFRLSGNEESHLLGWSCGCCYCTSQSDPDGAWDARLSCAKHLSPSSPSSPSGSSTPLSKIRLGHLANLHPITHTPITNVTHELYKAQLDLLGMCFHFWNHLNRVFILDFQETYSLNPISEWAWWPVAAPYEQKPPKKHISLPPWSQPLQPLHFTVYSKATPLRWVTVQLSHIWVQIFHCCFSHVTSLSHNFKCEVTVVTIALQVSHHCRCKVQQES